MSRRNKDFNFGKVVWAFILISIFAPWLFKLAGALLSMVVGLGVFAVVIAFIVKLTKGNSYSEVKRDPRPTKNPYSVNYDKSAVEAAEAFRQAEIERAKQIAAQKAAQAQAKAAEQKTVIDTTYKGVTKETPKHKTTGDAEIDRMIVEKDDAIEKMKLLDEAIEDEKLSEQIVHLEAVTERIVDYITTHPKKKKQMGKFFDYYLPTTLKLLEAYGRMDEAGISGTNIDGTKERVEDMMDTALAAFDKQLDALYADEALDVSTDITVMQNMLKAEGLTEDNITSII